MQTIHLIPQRLLKKIMFKSLDVIKLSFDSLPSILSYVLVLIKMKQSLVPGMMDFLRCGIIEQQYVEN